MCDLNILGSFCLGCRATSVEIREIRDAVFSVSPPWGGGIPKKEGEDMTFGEVLKEIREGKNVNRRAWVQCDANTRIRTEVKLWQSGFSWMEDRLLTCTYAEDGPKFEFFFPDLLGLEAIDWQLVDGGQSAT